MKKCVYTVIIDGYDSLKEPLVKSDGWDHICFTNNPLVNKSNVWKVRIFDTKDLDNKKARSEKEALLEQFAILSNTLEKDMDLRVCFATAYNRYGEGKPWRQERVRQFFADDELLIGKDFWNFVWVLNHISLHLINQLHSCHTHHQ